MDKDRLIIPLIQTIKALLEWFNVFKVDGVIIGGIAASLIGKPRTTKDIMNRVELILTFPLEHCLLKRRYFCENNG